MTENDTPTHAPSNEWERKRVATLQRRLDHLDGIVDGWVGPKEKASYTIAEAHALRWALALIDEAIEAGFLAEVRDRLPGRRQEKNRNRETSARIYTGTNGAL